MFSIKLEMFIFLLVVGGTRWGINNTSTFNGSTTCILVFVTHRNFIEIHFIKSLFYIIVMAETVH